MPMKMKLLAALAATCLCLSGPVRADKFPDHPLTMIIPFAAGGPTDILGRSWPRAWARCWAKTSSSRMSAAPAA